MESNDLKPGKIETLKDASKKRAPTTLLKKDFSKSTIDSLTLSDSIFSKCSFDEAKIYNCKFNSCEFLKNTFVGANLSIIEFSSCEFYSVDFSNSTMSNVKFDASCKFIDCKMDGVNLMDGTIGIDATDFNVIHEQVQAVLNNLEAIGFNKKGEDEFEKDVSENVKMYFVHDDEMNSDADEPPVWRLMTFVNDESILTTDITLDDRITNEYLNQIIDYNLKTVLKKIQTLFDSDVVESLTKEIKNYLAR